MRTLVLRGSACLTLSTWLLSACVGHVLWLHVQTEHHGHHYGDRPHGLEVTAPHAEEHGDHEHRQANIRSSATPSPRPHAPAPILAAVPFDPPSMAPRRESRAASIPPPRGSPQRHTILLI
jgi:hypothetical protein